MKTVCVVALGFDAARTTLTLLRRYDSAAKSTGAAPHYTQPKQAKGCCCCAEAYGCDMAEQTAPKLVQDTAEPPAREPTAATPAAPPTPGLDAPMRATAERLVAEAAEAAPKPEPPAPVAEPPSVTVSPPVTARPPVAAPPPPPPPQPSPPPARRPPRACRSRSNVTDSGLDDAMPLAAAADLVKNAKKVVVVSGSGISAAAGLSTYVGGKDGLYEKARKRYKLEKGIDLFGWRFYSERPRDAQKFLAELAVAVQKAQPTPTHRALVDLERSGVLMRHITLNIDGLHAQAGASLWDGSDGTTVELHGALREVVDCENGNVYALDDEMLRRIKGGRDAVDGKDAPRDALRVNGSKKRPLDHEPPLRTRFRVLLYGDREHARILDGPQALQRLKDDCGGADLVLFLGISFEQSASCEYLRDVAAVVQRETPVLLVNPDAECLYTAASALPRGSRADVRSCVATSDELFGACGVGE